MEHYEGDNIGSIAECLITFPFAFSHFPGILNSGYTWEKIPFNPGTGNLFLKVADSDNGPVYTYNGGGRVHRMRKEADDMIFEYIVNGGVMKVTDMNGKVYIIGNPDAPVTVSLSGGTGTNYTDENGMDIQFKIEQGEPALS